MTRLKSRIVRLVPLATVAAALSQAWPAAWSPLAGQEGIGVTDLAALGGLRSNAYAIHNLAQVAGYSHDAAGEDHATLQAVPVAVVAPEEGTARRSRQG